MIVFCNSYLKKKLHTVWFILQDFSSQLVQSKNLHSHSQVQSYGFPLAVLKTLCYKSLWIRHIEVISPVSLFYGPSELVRWTPMNFKLSVFVCGKHKQHTLSIFSIPKSIHSKSLGDLSNKMHYFTCENCSDRSNYKRTQARWMPVSFDTFEI